MPTYCLSQHLFHCLECLPGPPGALISFPVIFLRSAGLTSLVVMAALLGESIPEMIGGGTVDQMSPIPRGIIFITEPVQCDGLLRSMNL